MFQTKFDALGSKIQKRWEITGYERTPKAYKVHKEHVVFLLQEIKKNKTITIEDLLYLLKNKYPILDLNKSHISRIIHDNDFFKIVLFCYHKCFSVSR